MENWDDKNLRINTPDSIIESHRDGLRSKLGKTPPRHGGAGKSLLVMSLLVIVGLSGLTVAYPSWAKDLYQTVIVRTITLKLDEGEVHIKTIQTECEPGEDNCESLIAGLKDLEGMEGNAKVIRKKVMVDEDKEITPQMLEIEAEAMIAGMEDGEIKTITIGTGDGGSKWTVNGREVMPEEMEEYVVSMSEADLHEEIEREIVASTDEAPTVASTFELGQNYPNPFNPTTQIPFELKESGSVTLKVYNMMGQEIATLVNGYKNAGTHTVTFNGAGLPSGVYVYAMEAGDYQFSRQMTLTK